MPPEPPFSKDEILGLIRDGCHVTVTQAADGGTTVTVTPPRALTPAERQRRCRQKVKAPVAPKASPPLPPSTAPMENAPARNGAKGRTADEMAAANALGLDDMLAGPELRKAWQDWKEWRTERATKPLVGEKAAPWALRAATLARKDLQNLAATTTPANAVESVDFSISKRYLSIVEVRHPSTPSRLPRAPIGPNHGSANRSAISEYK